MKIIIPIASTDKDIFTEFSEIKPLVKLGNKTMIQKFIENFKFNFEYIFLCKQQDLIETQLLNVLKNLKVKKKIIEIKKNTSSVIETVNYAKKYLKPNDQVLICHPDNINFFFSRKKLLSKLKNNNIDGYLFAFDEDSQTNTSETHTGRVILNKNKIKRIIEKSIKIENSKRLAGIYHFKKWSDYLKYSKKTIENQLPVSGRFFVSQVYNEYLRDKKKIEIFLIKKHITFGLVPYIKEYNFWHKYFKKNISRKLKYKFNFINLVPSCGEGERFTKKNKNNFKPLIQVDKKYMITKTIESLPKTNKNVVIMRHDHDKKYKFGNRINRKIKNLEILKLENKTSGMASTCYEYLKNFNQKKPILISSCDYAVIFDEEKFQKIISFFNPDVIIWTFKGYPDARISPFAYAYCEIKNGSISKISEKTPISDNPHLDHIAQGIFYFKSKEIFMKAYKKMVIQKNKINNEYYVGNSINQLIKENYVVIPFEVEQYICLGTVNDLKIYNFWSDFFNNDKS